MSASYSNDTLNKYMGIYTETGGVSVYCASDTDENLYFVNFTQSWFSFGKIKDKKYIGKVCKLVNNSYDIPNDRRDEMGMHELTMGADGVFDGVFIAGASEFPVTLTLKQSINLPEKPILDEINGNDCIQTKGGTRAVYIFKNFVVKQLEPGIGFVEIIKNLLAIDHNLPVVKCMGMIKLTKSKIGDCHFDNYNQQFNSFYLVEEKAEPIDWYRSIYNFDIYRENQTMWVNFTNSLQESGLAGDFNLGNILKLGDKFVATDLNTTSIDWLLSRGMISSWEAAMDFTVRLSDYCADGRTTILNRIDPRIGIYSPSYYHEYLEKIKESNRHTHANCSQEILNSLKFFLRSIFINYQKMMEDGDGGADYNKALAQKNALITSMGDEIVHMKASYDKDIKNKNALIAENENEIKRLSNSKNNEEPMTRAISLPLHLGVGGAFRHRGKSKSISRKSKLRSRKSKAVKSKLRSRKY